MGEMASQTMLGTWALDTAHCADAPRLNEIECADCLDYLRRIPDGTVDLVVTSPPYNMRATVNGAKTTSKSLSNWNGAILLSNGYDGHDDAMPYAEYVAWQREVLHECMRVLTDAGAMFYNQKWRIQGGLLDRRDGITEGFPVRQIIIWNRGSGNNHNPAFFSPQYEVLYLIAKRRFYRAEGAVDYGDVWDISPTSDNPHPAPFPLAIPERCILSTPARVVLDPFMGSGTTALAARKCGINFMGCDKSSLYVEMAHKELEKPYTLPMFEREAVGK